MLLFFSLFALYLSALCPTIYAGDSSLFVAASFSLGSAHPPGYPLYIILGKLLTFLPFGNIAFKVNLVNALFGSLTCVMVYKTSMELHGNSYASWAAAVICGISPLFFTESVKAEVYTLNSFLSMVVFYLGLRILKGGDFKKLSLMSVFAVGLGMGNHHTIGFMGLILLFPIAVRWKEISMPWLLTASVVFLAGFSVNLFLYLRSAAMDHSGGMIVYSYAGNWEEFLKVILRQQYAGSTTIETVTRGMSFGKSWFYGLKQSLMFVAYPDTKPVLIFLFLGIAGLRNQKKELLYFVFSFIVWLALLGKMVWGTESLKNDDIAVISVFFLPVIPILYCLASEGFSSVLSFLRRNSFDLLHVFSSYAFAILLPLSLLPYSYKAADLSKTTVAYDYGRDMLSVLPVKSLLLNYHDNPIFITFYMRAVERLREDVLVIATAGKEDVYGMESSPEWKYAFLYPFFYEKKESSLREINAAFGDQGKLFSNNPFGLTKAVSENYHYYPYIFSVALYPKKMDVNNLDQLKADLRSKFKTHYQNIAYEYAGEMPSTHDFLVNELLNGYSFATMIYADFTIREGKEYQAYKLYKRAFSISDPGKYLWPYLNFLFMDDRSEEALAFVAELKKTEGEYGELARLLEAKVVSAIKEKGTTPAP